MLAALALASVMTCASPSPPARFVDTHELLTLRDISGLSVSPDGRHVAFQVQQADLDANSYRSVWCVAPIETSARAAPIGDGGGIAMPILPVRERRTGVWVTLTARWSPDGAWVGFLARREEQTQIEICNSLGRGCRRLTDSAGDVEDFAWLTDGSGIVYQAAFSRTEATRERAFEADRGYRLDERFDVFHAFMPARSHAPRLSSRVFIDLAGNEREPRADEIAHFLESRRRAISTSMGSSRSVTALSAAPTPIPDTLAGRDVRMFVRMQDGGAVWLEPADPTVAGATAPAVLMASSAGELAPIRCSSEPCVGRIVELAPTPDSQQVLFIRREGWADSRYGLYLWQPSTGAVRRLMLTDDIVRICTALATSAVCFREGPTRPRVVISIDYHSGRTATIFDPNLHLPERAFLPAGKLEWRTPVGDEVFGYVVAPARTSQRRPPPLIVVQYRAGGLLRGGVGDEYPIQAFARRGFAVLALERPDPEALTAVVRDADEIDRREWEGLSERRRTLAALTSGIDQVIALGLADRQRVGITGLSDGAETAVFGLIHCRCIAAAAISSGVHDPNSLFFASDTERRAMRAGGRGENGEAGTLWPDLSLSLNARRINTPILAQVADRELVFMLQAHRTFTDMGRPFDLYVFPDEYHVKWQPRHRQAIYARSLDWFSFWLQDAIDPDPDKQAQYEVWRGMRERMRGEHH